MGVVSELRARFSAQISGFKQAVSELRSSISGIGTDAGKATKTANATLDGLIKSISRLRAALNSAGGGSSSAFAPLERALQSVENDLKELGRISANSLGELTNATEGASRAIRSLSDEGKDLSHLESAINDVESELKQLNDIELDELARSAQKAENEIDDIGDAGVKSANEAEGAFSRLTRTLKGVAATYLGFEALKNTVSVLGESFISANADMETYENTLTTVLKSNKKAVETLKWAESFAASTPFEIPDIVEATAKLQVYGINAKETLKDIGDMAAITGKPLMQAVEAVADAQTGELERLKEFGITKQMLIDKAAELGKKEIVNAQGQITDMKGLNEALFAIMRERYSGGMEIASNSFKGLVSNAKDSMGTIARELGKPVFEKFKQGLQSVVPVLGAVTQMVNGDTKGAMDTLTSAFGEEKAGQIMNFIQKIKNGFQGFLNFIKSLAPALENIKGIVSNLAPVFAFAGGVIAVAFKAIAVILSLIHI